MGRYDLNLSEEDFWGLTLKEFNALSERYTSNQEWLTYRSALICSVLANTVRDPKRKRTPFTPQDFMPGKKQTQPQQSAKQMFATVKMLNAAFRGTVKRR